MSEDENKICPNQPYAEHIVVRCSGCGSRHSTKNIGSRDPKTNRAYLQRNLFDIYGETCKCKDPSEFPLVHDCAVDDIKYDYATRKFIPLTQKETPMKPKELFAEIRKRAVENQLTTGKHYVVTAQGIPIAQLTYDDIKPLAKVVAEEIKKNGSPETDWDKLQVTDTLSGEKKPLKSYLD